MHNGDLLILKGHEVRALLEGRETDLIRAVRDAYDAHAAGRSSLPHSTFLRFPEDARNRIIALPAYLNHGSPVAGVKWVSSFPGNLDTGLDRASAVMIMNSAATGRPEAVLEGSLISAKRTAASAALAAQCLSGAEPVTRVGMIGCGLINFEIARFLLAVSPKLSALTAFDIDANRARQFKEKCERQWEGVEVEVAEELPAALACPVVSFATTAGTPYVTDLSACPPGVVLLHISLRDLSPEVILSSDNVVDDIDHVCRAQTSVHLAEQLAGNRNFIRCTLADVFRGTFPARRDDESAVIFSPFGLGILDIAVGRLTCELAARDGAGMVIDSFLPHSWAEEGKQG